MKREFQSRAQEVPLRPQSVRAFLDLFDGHFPGHTMQRVRTPQGDYRYTYVSPGVKETFGLDPELLIAQDAVQHDWVHDEDRARFLAALESSHAVHQAMQMASTMPKTSRVVICLSGRGDKDAAEIARLRGEAE